MTRIKYYFLLLTFCFCYLLSFGQQNKIDSLLTVIKKDKEDTNKVSNSIALCNLFRMVGNNDTALFFGNSAIHLAEKLNFKKGVAKASTNIGIVYGAQGDPKALDYFLKALKINKELGDKNSVASTFNHLGNTYLSQADYPKALDNFLNALKINEELGDKKGISRNLNSIGVVFIRQGDQVKALDYFFRTLKICEEMGDKEGLARTGGSIGNVYYTQNNFSKALEYHIKALKLSEELGNKSAIAFWLGNIGADYVTMGDPKALEYLMKALNAFDEIGDKQSVAINLGNIGQLYKDQKKYNEAETYFLKALSVAEEIGLNDIKQWNHKELSDIYAAKGEYKKSLEHYKQYSIVKDSLFNEEKNKQLTRHEMNYEFEKKEALTKAEHDKERALAEAEKKKQNIIIFSVISGLILVVLFAGFIFRSLRVTRKQKQFIEVKNKETELQKHIIEEKHKEISDSINYAERIQRSFLASKSLLDENLKDYFVFFQPKDVVSGDFYWATKLSNNNFALATADSTGHGVPGAIMSILNISCLENSTKDGLLEPSDILNNTRANIIERLKKDGSIEGGKDGMDCSLISFDFKNNKLTYAAGNNPIWIVREKQLLEFAPDKMPVGKHDKDTIPFTQHLVYLEKDDVVYALTDGMPDQFGGPKGKKFMYKQLKELLVSVAHLPMHEQNETLKSSLNNWKGNLEQVDDICLIGIRV